VASGPLQGVRILDLTRVVAGPYATGLLAELGARVVKIEQPGGGDEIRLYPDQVRGLSIAFNDLNRNKESLTLDLRTGRGREILCELATRFDVLTENFAPGTLERWGLGWEALQQRNPRLVYASLSGFGQDGPYASHRSYDLVAQATGGLMFMTGDPDGPPMKTGTNLADYVGGVFLALGILAALRERDASGLGQRLDISNQDALVTMLDSAVNWFRASGEQPARSGNFHRKVAPYGAYRAKDGWVVIAIGSPKMFPQSFAAIGREDLLEDPAFMERVRRFAFRDELNALWSSWVAERSCAEVERVCRERGLGFGRVKSVEDLAADRQLEHRGMLTEVEHPDGEGPIPTRGVPIRLERTPGSVRRAAPTLGQDTERLLEEFLGLGPEEVERLRGEGIL
jgi:crotonobetainyl-CoA:carnitine CoA-transferase CaiB-like acyl-CoA transferase